MGSGGVAAGRAGAPPGGHRSPRPPQRTKPGVRGEGPPPGSTPRRPPTRGNHRAIVDYRREKSP
eukprot:13427969-Alexandrium_andersonii.AAC.1